MLGNAVPITRFLASEQNGRFFPDRVKREALMAYPRNHIVFSEAG
jgi:hypothetical protein